MPFEKGNKLGGRKIGSKGKMTNEIREHYKTLIQGNLKQLDQDIKSLEPYQRLKILLEFSKFIIPTLKQQDFTIESENTFTPVEINLVDETEIKNIVRNLNDKY